ncbi:hypothetical protein U27_06350 [Candidatus Vecturithrix granuli]|uniref:TonB-dependent receptor n=1 Tax=Vecturithrix granuli TaxID=1499967 RepID=A0A081C461_VECG1|nr:hypothetical protein U27_06350 [Candidatus Vecturithrix granuli]
MKQKSLFLMIFLVGILAFTPICGICQDDPFAEAEDMKSSLDEEMEWLQAETYVITASKVLENIKKSAASITVITDRDIQQMGDREFKDVLRLVPGLSYRDDRHNSYDIDARGVMKDGIQHILFLYNGHSLNTNYWGGVGPSYEPLVLDNIQRIEVIRGPGSALYGANAFSAIVNVITKDAKDIEGVQFSARGGSYDTQQYNLLFGKTLGEVGIAMNVNYYKTNGFEGYIEKDGQTLLDQLIGSQASLAPGYTEGDDEKYDLSLTLEYQGFRFDGKYADRDRKPSIGISPVLNEDSETPSTDYTLSLSYERSIGKGVDLLGRVYRNYTYMDYYYQVYPDNTVLPTPDGLMVWPDGLIGAPSNKNTRTGGEVQATYKMNDVNTIVAGVTYEEMKQYDVKALSNYLATPIKDVVIPRWEISEVSHIQNYNKNVSRTFKAAFLEDLWDLRENLRLTVGARYDDYSDFGGSFNPRAGLVWEFLKGYDLKLLYGRAFRAPSFYELYNTNNPAFVGNPDLDPETVDTVELSVGANLTSALSARITGFYNSIKDSIDLVTYDVQDIFENSSEIRARGIEAEWKYDFGKGTYLAMNYTYQDSQNLDTDRQLYDIPKHKGNVLSNIRISKYLNFYADLHFEEGFTREKGDIRQDDNPGFAVVNTTILAKKFWPRFEGLELRGSVYNVFDKDYTVPTAKDSLPVDYPMPGRSFLVEMRATF